MSKGNFGFQMDGTYKPVFKHSSSAGLTSLTATNVATLNQWYHVTGVVDRPAGTVKTYVNGVLDKSGTFLGNSPATAVGESPFSLTSSVNASFDEVRAESKARSAEWVKATFDNQKKQLPIISGPLVPRPVLPCLPVA
jgi:hypothetical protein